MFRGLEKHSIVNVTWLDNKIYNVKDSSFDNSQYDSTIVKQWIQKEDSDV